MSTKTDSPINRSGPPPVPAFTKQREAIEYFNELLNFPKEYISNKEEIDSKIKNLTNLDLFKLRANSNEYQTLSRYPSLEMQFADQCLVDVDVHAKCNFDDFLEPNEYEPEGIEPHLKMVEQGICNTAEGVATLEQEGLHVITGAERFFFMHCFSDEKKCQGGVGRDINPRVKAYNDFNILLLRIAKNKEEYIALSETVYYEDSPEEKIAAIKTRISIIAEKMENSDDIPNKVKDYYRKHLQDFAFLYLQQPRRWKKDPSLESKQFVSFSDSNHRYFKSCQYHLDNAQFLKLQACAKSGNMISTIGGINDLVFLKSRKVTVIDTSNISDYVMLDIRLGNNLKPLVIHTHGTGRPTTYCSYIHEPLTKQEDCEFDMLVKSIKSALGLDNIVWFLKDKFQDHCWNLDPNEQHHDKVPGAVRCRKILGKMKTYVGENNIPILSL